LSLIKIDLEGIIMDNDRVISTLNNLIETCKDGEQGFRTAADGVRSSDLKTLFHTYAQQRSRFAAELQSEVRRLGGDPERTGSTVGALHRGWIDIKSAVTGRDDNSIIAECERGEDSAVRNYEDALREHLPSDIQSIVGRQFNHIKEAHDRIRSLERSFGARA
jgi:uncharacterized protein (TIGR02284 family)